ncbi:hypothetical protein K491DRAFT_64742 [Lophiostoma macrostomum CBS 122681]|uniref:DUF7708 domain-containing protein n=1 Tax=Lophiostoma macrostomum CBS 122681 TaxID=1314788 RepID=A0A6A6SZV6_9PLEO|nr:hypothetical protein K491DRAFT_64742 [Lophiostoma macrostomum CBS 122681]
MSNLALGDPPLDLCAPGVGTWGASLSAEGTTDRRAGWLNSYVHSEKLKDPTSELQVTLHDLSSTISEGERKQFEHLQEQCCREFLNVIEAGALKQAKEGKRNKYLKKVNEASEDFCHVALHYQNVFDVLSNTGDYTSVIWGALKILMLYKINNRELQQEVQKHLGDIGEWMTELCAYQYIPQTKAMQNIITATYTLLLKFLAEALKYYKDSRLG